MRSSETGIASVPGERGVSKIRHARISGRTLLVSGASWTRYPSTGHAEGLGSDNWRRRTEIIDYCVNVVDHSMDEKRRSLDEKEGDLPARRKIQGDLFAEEVKVI